MFSEAISPAMFWLPADERGRSVFGSTSKRNEPPLRLVKRKGGGAISDGRVAARSGGGDSKGRRRVLSNGHSRGGGRGRAVAESWRRSTRGRDHPYVMLAIKFPSKESYRWAPASSVGWPLESIDAIESFEVSRILYAPVEFTFDRIGPSAAGPFSAGETRRLLELACSLKRAGVGARECGCFHGA